MERLRTRSASQDNNIGIRINQTKNIFTSAKQHSSLDSQHRRPSSIAEQAMRKLDVNNSSYIRGEQQQVMTPSSRYHGSFIASGMRPIDQSILQLRESKIMDSTPLPPHSHYLRHNLPSRHSVNYMGLLRDRSADYVQYDSLVGIPLRETAIPPTMADTSSRTASNRLLTHGLDQRIIKQSTEDCRRLLQQVIRTRDFHRFSSVININLFEC